MPNKSTFTTPVTFDKGEMTLAVLQQQNEIFRSSGGVSEENRGLGFRPAFYDMETGVVYTSRFANGREAPMHVLDGLPSELVVSRGQSQRVTAVKPSIISGFVRNSEFFTREQAALATAQMLDRSQLISDPEKNNQLHSAWERFVLEQEYPSDLIRPIVKASWQRCHESKVDPELRYAPLLSDQDHFEERLSQQADLLSASRPVLKHFGELLYHSDSLLLVADVDGLILDVQADLEVRSKASDVNLIEGGIWGEVTVGTNSIGTAITAAAPVQLYGAEHFCAGIKYWTCSADVIRDPHDGRVVCAVDLSGLTNSYQHNALEFASTVARAVESNLAADYFRARQQVIQATQSIFQRWKMDGLLAVDRRGRLVKANLQAYQVLQELGINITLTPQSRIPALDLEAPQSSATEPHWLKNQLRYPIKSNSGVVGSLIVLSHHI